jgi:tRNA modification GTPase
MAQEGDTIFALATPPGKSAIAVLRISGPQAAEVAMVLGAKCPQAGRFALAKLRGTNGQTLDEALLLFMVAPHSSTGEDVLEIHCHGGIAVVRSILDRLSEIPGLRTADPGEFTHRMFQNDKIDLLGVEALADVIDADTGRQLDQAWAQMRGVLRDPATRWRQAIIRLSAEVEAIIDFPDEDIPPDVANLVIENAKALISEIDSCLNDDHIGEQIRDGVTIALVGPANAGKSTLLNHLAKRPVAIVSDEAGTTRDVLSVSLDIGGVPVNLVDTAGIRENVGAVEAEGVRRALSAAREADHVIMVLDGSDRGWPEQMEILASQTTVPAMVVLNKSDQGIEGKPPENAAVMSLLKDQNLSGFEERLTELVVAANRSDGGSIITRARHRQALLATVHNLRAGLAIDLEMSPEIVAEEFRAAAMALGRITGEIEVEELLDSIFSSFCIGK